MSDCCKPEYVVPSKKAICPVNGHAYNRIQLKTVLHQIRKPWQKDLDDHYYFCTDANCDVVYFSQSGHLLRKPDIRAGSSYESSDLYATICYCFDVSAADVASEQSMEMIRHYIIEQTKNNLCECSIRNPSGQCCLRNFK
ncbi:MAG: hypothetical protein OEY87_02180 [Gammaproteobacteria bacterium]|nr:hypothetical protein [Gammaproteobacteria bacterium]MDH5734907.1 hypothetical protein [Gammaproteobacteria bacterium]